MSKFGHIATKAGGLAIVTALSTALSGLVGGVIYLADHSYGVEIIPGIAILGCIGAAIVLSGLGRYIAKTVDGWGYLALIPLLVVQFLIIWPMALLAAKMNWIVLEEK